MRKTRKKIGEYGKTVVTLGVSTAIGAGMASASPGVAPMMSAYPAMAGMTGIAGTAVMGGEALRHARNIGKRKRGKKR